jgi:hypothetical protein
MFSSFRIIRNNEMLPLCREAGGASYPLPKEVSAVLDESTQPQFI